MSKFGRKLSHLFSALVLLLSVFVALPGLAKADTAPETIKLTINDKSSDFKYNGYRIMTAEVNGEDKDAVKYTLNKKYENVVLDAAKSVDPSVTDFTSFKAFLKKEENKNSANSTTGESSEMRKFADQLYKKIQSANLEPDKTFNSGNNDVKVDTEAGYYLLVDATADNANNPHNYSATLLTSLVNKDVTLNVKSSTPIVHKKVLEGDTDKKETERSYVDATDYAAGDTIPFMITGTISSQIKSYDNYTYYFTDTLPKGLDLDPNSIAVQAESVADGSYAKGINATKPKELTKDTDGKVNDWKATVTKNDDGTTSLRVDLHDLKDLVEHNKLSTDDTIVVTYNAKLNDNAVIGQAGNVNNVKLTYSNNPTSEGTGTTTNKNAKVYTYELDVNKVTGQKALAGAGFTLYKKDAKGEYKEVKVLTPEDAIAGSDSNVKNKYVFKELDQGEYQIRETTVPKGYHKADDVTFKITATFEGQNTAGAALKTLSVDNNSLTPDTNSGIISTNVNNVSDKGFVLPSTGGMGRYIFLAAGALVVVAAVAFPSLKKKKLQ
ncbi:isopeptide-forming domain-containing fimbrial protein [uncultured Lactobacillus sp.]|uniref:isopeptide-forming domain-containing fimbrial protein n=1 Tax=uncultured Lactobacillus sp. TaxID=153152 RepID=UPI002626A6A8|nr:isopeptide-forming domain-containing fimbrial protein [uncultured Lactobacillus sp.]